MFVRVATSTSRRFSSKLQNLSVARHFSGVKDYPQSSSVAQQLKTSFELPCPTEAQADGNKAFQLTKIVATIGPTSEQLEPLKQVVGAGMKIMRLNFSHATTEEVELRLTNLAQAQVSENQEMRQTFVLILLLITFLTLKNRIR